MESAEPRMEWGQRDGESTRAIHVANFPALASFPIYPTLGMSFRGRWQMDFIHVPQHVRALAYGWEASKYDVEPLRLWMESVRGRGPCESAVESYHSRTFQTFLSLLLH